MPSVIILNECYHQVTRQNKCLGEAPATQHPSWEPQLVGFKLQTQSYRIKHGSVRTEVWFWLETSLHHQHIILSVLKHSVPHLLCIFDSYTKKRKGSLTWYFGHCSFASENEEDELIELSKEEELSPPGFSWQHFPNTRTWASLQSFWNTDMYHSKTHSHEITN